jgi:SAM-dependent methyltransferase
VWRVYDATADAYAERFAGELAHKPFDRDQLDRFAAATSATAGWVCDLGCGPGQVARYLRERGLRAFAADLSPEQLRQARRLSPDAALVQLDMLRLPLAAGALAGAVAFYSVIHFSLDQAERAFRELARALAPGGRLLLAFHVADADAPPGTPTHGRHVDEFLGRPVQADFVLFRPADVAARLEAAGLDVEQVATRLPYPGIEYPSRRAYVRARPRRS